MSNRNLVKVFLLVALLGLSLMPFSQALPKRGRKRSFGESLDIKNPITCAIHFNLELKFRYYITLNTAKSIILYISMPFSL